jgi:uncharacterized protein (DUF433 family)/DNA-binding transcriptional MerR regulator
MPVALGDGIYSVATVCRLLRPTMTRRKVHYWLRTGLISPSPYGPPGRGRPTLLSFRQLLEIRVVQQLRDEVGVPLPAVRPAFAWILSHALDAEAPIRFARGPGGRLLAETGEDAVEVPGGQIALPLLERLGPDLEAARAAWRTRALPIGEHVVSDPRVLGGAPTLRGSRVETALIAAYAPDRTYDDATVAAVLADHPWLGGPAVVEALAFEGAERRTG